MIYSVYVEIFPDYDIVDWDYFGMENIVSKDKLSYDEVVELALTKALEDLEEIHGVSEKLVKYTKATVVSAIENDCFKD
jgi:hypothetical protein